MLLLYPAFTIVFIARLYQKSTSTAIEAMIDSSSFAKNDFSETNATKCDWKLEPKQVPLDCDQKEFLGFGGLERKRI